MARESFQAPASRCSDRIVFERGFRRTVVSLPRHGVYAMGALVAVLGLWSIATVGYFVFHDTVIYELRQASLATARGYEAQIGALRDQIERARTRGMVERTGMTERLTELNRRQQELEKRQTRLAELADPVADDVTGSTEAAAAFSTKPIPLDQPVGALDNVEDARARADDASDKIEGSLDKVEASQIRTLEGLASKTSEKRKTLEKVYDAVRVPKPAANADGKGRGGPFEPLPARALTFESRADEIALEQDVVEGLDRGLARVPLRTPAPGAMITSGFGARSDPFLGRPAFHAGIDFEEPYGDTVKATAVGKVTIAGWTGGYGNMVEIDHGGGVTTRFGHLSAILVAPGQQVKVGTPLGRVGSTGRSTGPHLHYETRINGEAVNPIRFLNAGRILAASAQVAR